MTPLRVSASYLQLNLLAALPGSHSNYPPSSNFKKQDKRETMRISQLWEKIHGLKRTLVTLLMLSVVIQSAALIAPYYMQWVVDNVSFRYFDQAPWVLNQLLSDN